MKSWLSIFLPKDEYKEKRVLQFLAEGSIILVLSNFILFIINNQYPLDAKIAMAIMLIIYLEYVTIRYILSGIEYADVATKEDYKKVIRRIWSRIIVFIILSNVGYLLVEMPKNIDKWINLWEVTIASSILWVVCDFISLNRSYKKNKTLM